MATSPRGAKLNPSDFKSIGSNPGAFNSAVSHANNSTAAKPSEFNSIQSLESEPAAERKPVPSQSNTKTIWVRKDTIGSKDVPAVK